MTDVQEQAENFTAPKSARLERLDQGVRVVIDSAMRIDCNRQVFA